MQKWGTSAEIRILSQKRCAPSQLERFILYIELLTKKEKTSCGRVAFLRLGMPTSGLQLQRKLKIPPTYPNVSGNPERTTDSRLVPSATGRLSLPTKTLQSLLSALLPFVVGAANGGSPPLCALIVVRRSTQKHGPSRLHRKPCNFGFVDHNCVL
jgi:hypothetical protein